MSQSENQLENKLIEQLQDLGYEFVDVKNTNALLKNLKQQLEKHNKKRLKGRELTTEEFKRVKTVLQAGNVFECSKILHDSIINITDKDGENMHLEILQVEHWCQNQFQVTNQFSQTGKRENRYDVTLLINGLPLVNIELKKRGNELKTAFEQINRYHRESFSGESGLFLYTQIFVISNGANTRYFANNHKQHYEQTFTWSDKNNKATNDLESFTTQFLEKCQLSKLICQYVVRHQSSKSLMVLRPYQYYAAERIYSRVKDETGNGYIWHTTGSGKTLTSFKTAQRLQSLPKKKVFKVLFVVDRTDLDHQTVQEFNHFYPDSVNENQHTHALVQQLEDTDRRLIVTTIQKLNLAIKYDKFQERIAFLQDKPIIFIFDECHRSQFGETNINIKRFFKNHQMFGFTGTPIFEQNSVSNKLGKRTTEDLFNKCLHKYLLPNAINDQNVLKFSIEYMGKRVQKDSDKTQDQLVKNIDTKEFFENEKRIGKVVDLIIENHDQKTHQRTFSAILCVSSINALHMYYNAFKEKQQGKENKLRVGTIFSANANEPEDGELGDPNFEVPDADNRDKLDSYIRDYNQMFKTEFKAKDSQALHTYYKNISKRLKENQTPEGRLDILLVVNMFLTGFDAKALNTMYVDKNLKDHGLIQAFSRTNRTFGCRKSQGNIVCFRDLKKPTDDAVKLFSDEENTNSVLMKPYKHYIKQINKYIQELHNIAAEPQQVDDLFGEEEQKNYVKAFRDVLREMNIARSFVEFTFDHIDMTEMDFDNYKSKYLDLHDKSKDKHDDGQASILDDIDFELELMHTDTINVDYIMSLLAQSNKQAKSSNKKEQEEGKKNLEVIKKLLGQESQLRNKKGLIEEFIDKHMHNMGAEDDFKQHFEHYWEQQKQNKLIEICDKEKLDRPKFEKMIQDYKYSRNLPKNDVAIKALNAKIKLAERNNKCEKIRNRIKVFIETFET